MDDLLKEQFYLQQMFKKNEQISQLQQEVNRLNGLLQPKVGDEVRPEQR